MSLEVNPNDQELASQRLLLAVELFGTYWRAMGLTEAAADLRYDRRILRRQREANRTGASSVGVGGFAQALYELQPIKALHATVLDTIAGRLWERYNDIGQQLERIQSAENAANVD